MSDQREDPPITVGRYLLHRQIARGGMATIHIARVIGDSGFSRIVAAKRMHPELAEDRDFVAMFLDEARIASKVHHRNIVPVLDVGTTDGEVVLVQEFVRGAPLAFLMRTQYRANAHVPIPVAVAIACQVLSGLHAAHEAVDEVGTPLHIVHRDVSPQNIMVATDGTARLLDFGVAKAALGAHVTRKGTFKGKLAYAAPEHIRGSATRQSDVYSLAVVLWELVAGQRLFRDAKTDDDLIRAIMKNELPLVTAALAEHRAFCGGYRWNQIEALAPIIHKGLSAEPRRRWTTAAEMEDALASSVPLASASDVAAWLQAVAGDLLEECDRMIAAEEASWRKMAFGTQTMPALDVPKPAVVTVEPPTAPITLPSPRSATTLGERPQHRTRWRHELRWRRELLTALAIGAALVAIIVLAVTIVRDDLDHTARVPVALPAAAVPAMTPQVSPIVTPPPPPPPAPAPSIEAPRSEPEPPAPPRPHAAPAHAPPHPSQPAHVRRRPPVATPAAPAASAPAAPAAECNPPYYFDGAKKIFKPACI